MQGETIFELQEGCEGVSDGGSKGRSEGGSDGRSEGGSEGRSEGGSVGGGEGGTDGGEVAEVKVEAVEPLKWHENRPLSHPKQTRSQVRDKLPPSLLLFRPTHQ